MYLSYGTAHQSWTNLTLILVCSFTALCLPLYSRLSNAIEQWAGFWTARVSAGRLARFVAQFLFNFSAMVLFMAGGALQPEGVAAVGGIPLAAFVTTLASIGAQYFGIYLFNRGIGDMNRNVLLGLSANILITAVALAGVPIIKELFLIVGSGIGLLVIGIGMASDLRGLIYPKRGIGIYFGTFNPFHISHLRLIETALQDRRLEKVIVHPTILPKFYKIALERGEVRMAGLEDGLQVMERTDKADANVNYFPAGNRFFAPETRKALIELAISEAGLTDRVEIAWYPEIYAESGFHGVIREIRRRHPKIPLHGIHGSDYGGMIVRSILDECGWIYPVPFRRRDKISATAIRAGAVGMTSDTVRDVLAQMANNLVQINTKFGEYKNANGVLIAE